MYLGDNSRDLRSTIKKKRASIYAKGQQKIRQATVVRCIKRAPCLQVRSSYPQPLPSHGTVIEGWEEAAHDLYVVLMRLCVALVYHRIVWGFLQLVLGTNGEAVGTCLRVAGYARTTKFTIFYKGVGEAQSMRTVVKCTRGLHVAYPTFRLVKPQL